MSEVSEFVLFSVMIESLDSAFMARQGRGEWHPDGWGERLFASLESDHAEWLMDMMSIYGVARRLLIVYAFRRLGEEFVGSLWRRPEHFLRTVLMLMKGPSYCAN